MQILDGKKARTKRAEILKERLKGCDKVFVVVLVGENQDSEVFVRMKQKFGKTLGVKVSIMRLEADVPQKKILKMMNELNDDEHIGGVIVQLPLPGHLDKQVILDSILLHKDIDALSSIAREVFYETRGKKAVPATPRGIMSLLDFYDVEINRKSAVVIGRSDLVGKPTAFLLEQAGADVTSCDKTTKNIPSITQKADIIIVAAGSPNLITAEYIDPEKKTIIVDVGITKDNNQKIHGDVDADGVRTMISALSPVPGGVGPMTVLSLFENFADAIE